MPEAACTTEVVRVVGVRGAGVRVVGVREVGVGGRSTPGLAVRTAAVLGVASALVLLGLARPVSAAAALAAVPPASPAWGWPLPDRPEVLRPFAPGPTRYSPGHYGVDLAGTPGTPVLAAGAGRVSFAGLVGGRGVVVLEHLGTGLRTSYEPVEALVPLAAEVERGEVVGLLAPLGHSCPGGKACLHWGLRRGQGDAAAYLDPLRLLVRPVRLLPRGAAPPAPPAAAVRPAPAAAVRPAPTGAAHRGASGAHVAPAAVRGAVSLLLPVAALLQQG